MADIAGYSRLVGFGAGFMTDERAGRLASAEVTAIKALSLAANHV